MSEVEPLRPPPDKPTQNEQSIAPELEGAAPSAPSSATNNPDLFRGEETTASLTAEPVQEGVSTALSGDQTAQSTLRRLMILPTMVLSVSEEVRVKRSVLAF